MRREIKVIDLMRCGAPRAKGHYVQGKGGLRCVLHGEAEGGLLLAERIGLRSEAELA